MGDSNEPAAAVPDACPLPAAQQTRNLLIFASCKGLIYLAAPVLYIGVQSAICDALGASTVVANLPKAVFLLCAVSPVLFAWYFPYVAYLRRSMTTLLCLAALGQLQVAAALAAPIADEWKIASVIVQSAIVGLTMPTSDSLIWEMLSRGVAESKRGLTLSLAFGVGPLFAAASSLASQAVLNDQTRAKWAPELHQPWTYIILFAATVPMLLTMAFLCSRVIVPLPERDNVREPFVQGVFGGSWDFLRDPVLRTASIVTILLYAGNAIDSNMNLYTEQALGESPKDYVGLQQFVRFGVKALAGLALGWLLTRSHPKAGLLATGLLFTISVLWALFVTGPWYLATFAFFGAGELIGVYAPNYILSASRRHQIRRNLCFANMILMPAGFAGILFGNVAEYAGFQASFVVCLVIMCAGVFLALVALPANPQRRDP